MHVRARWCPRQCQRRLAHSHRRVASTELLTEERNLGVAPEMVHPRRAGTSPAAVDQI